MSLWHRLFHPSFKQLEPSATDQATNAVIRLLQGHHLLGEILLQLPRQFDSEQSATAGLSWQGNRLVLRLNPQQFCRLHATDQELLLAHEALHVLWQHPLRYAHYPHPDLVKVATDVAVNQYLPAAPAGTVTLSQLRRLLRKKIPAQRDSREYLTMLEQATIEERERLKKGGIRLNGHGHGHQPALGSDSHQGWRQNTNGQQVNQQLRIAHLRHLLQHAWYQTPKRDRGLLPGEVVQQLSSVHSTATFNWWPILRQQVGQIVRGKEASHARFNRRQPWRMDLPGQISHQTADLRIFIDNSGSMTDDEINQALTTVSDLVRTQRAVVTVYTFDAKVYGPGRKLRSGHQIKWQRQGGGGTSFQAIFDYLCAHHVPRAGTIIVIITDGWGEQELQMHRYRNVDWLLTTAPHQLSVQVPYGHVFQLKEGKNNGNDIEPASNATRPDS